MDKRQHLKGQRLIALFLGGGVFFNYPLLLLFSNDGFVWGIPILYVYIFVSWVVLIGLTAIVIETRK